MCKFAHMVFGRIWVLFNLIKRTTSGPCHGEHLHRVVYNIPEDFLQSGQIEGKGQYTGPELLSFCNLISEVTSHLFCRILFVRGELTSSAHIQEGEGYHKIGKRLGHGGHISSRSTCSTPGAEHRWTSDLAVPLQQKGVHPHTKVLPQKVHSRDVPNWTQSKHPSRGEWKNKLRVIIQRNTTHQRERRNYSHTQYK